MSPEDVLALQRTAGNRAVSRLADENEPAPARRSSVEEVLSRPGTPLAAPVRAEMEARLGADFSGVRLHTGPAARESAAEIGARAYTSGDHVVIGDGGGDKHTLAHELTHVIQQRSGPVAGTDNGSGLRISDPGDRFERAAEQNAYQAMRTQPDGPGDRDGEYPMQLLPAQRATGNGVIQKIPDPAGKEHVSEREDALSDKYGVRIGPKDEQGPHFSDAMLDLIDEVLGWLPEDHVRGNAELKAIEPATGGAASAYDPRSQTIKMVSPFGMPWWLYAILNRGSDWQRWLMDRGALVSYDGISIGEILGISGSKRRVMGGVSDSLAHGNLVKWTVLHETGHAVDKKIGWEDRNSGEERFGGWLTYDEDTYQELAKRILKWAGFSDRDLRTAGEDGLTLRDSVKGELDPDEGGSAAKRLAEVRNKFAGSGEDFLGKFDKVIEFVTLAFSQPWTLEDGGGDRIKIRNRRYHVDHYGQWVSYLAREREDHAVSNYQFSTPGEWFAEAYAAYYDRESDKARKRLRDDVQAWFKKHLGERTAARSGSEASTGIGTSGHPSDTAATSS